MKPYGYSRKDMLTCKYGCCTMKENHPTGKTIFTRQNRKTARQVAKNEINFQTIESKSQD